MQHIKTPVYALTVYLLIYAVSYQIGLPYPVTALMFAFSPVLIIWLVISVLKKGVPSGRTFEEGYFYDDVELRGVGDENH